MRFTTIFTSAAAMMAAIIAPVLAAETTTNQANPISAPLSQVKLTAGKPFTIEWLPTAGNQVTLVLRKGKDVKSLDTLEVIAKDLPNNGAFIWVPSPQLKGDVDYAIQIWSKNPDTSNYSAQFVIDSNGPGIQGTTVVPSTTRAVATPTRTGAVPTYTGAETTDIPTAAAAAAANGGMGMKVVGKGALVGGVAVMAAALVL
ncbi:Ser-Thr-rich glycosyl-phosphatidyl-inositol-anchored membrane family-domain-containing protein [Pyronema omphalodes]|nr:Ser-Thr-rich glycosyl-phosphatidyl-inositol-anchored membrane family-domain-containing protein [Pyronema omphalodes]